MQDPQNKPQAHLWPDNLPRFKSAAELVRETQATGLEESAVRYVASLLKIDLRQLRREAKSRGNTTALSFLLFDECHPGFPVRLATSRLKFHYDGVATDLFSNVRETPMYAAWSELQAIDWGDRACVLIFRWPRIKGCKQFCVFHALERQDRWYDDFKKNDPRLGFRLAIPDRDHGVFSIEPLPSLLAALQVLPDFECQDDDDDA